MMKLLLERDMYSTEPVTEEDVDRVISRTYLSMGNILKRFVTENATDDNRYNCSKGE